MTTKAAAELYRAQYAYKMESKGYAIFNPLDKPIEELPIIYGFNNGGATGFLFACLLAEDGTALGGHACSHESYMPHDLGILEGSRTDRHEGFKKHYPDGYRMDFIGREEAKTHPGLCKAYENYKAKNDE